MTRKESYNRIDAIIAKHEIDDEYVTITNSKDYDALRIARKALEQKPSNDMVSRGVFKQVMWERDVAIGQLKELGYSLGEKIREDSDTIDGNDVLDKIKSYVDHIKRTGMGKKKSLEFIDKFIEGLKTESEK